MLKNYKLFDAPIDYFGHVIWPGFLELAQYSSDIVKELIKVTIQTELRSFLGFFNVSRQFVSTFAGLKTPQTKIRKDGLKPFVKLDEKKSVAVSSLKEAHMSPLVLALPKSESHHNLNTVVSISKLDV